MQQYRRNRYGIDTTLASRLTIRSLPHARFALLIGPFYLLKLDPLCLFRWQRTDFVNLRLLNLGRHGEWSEAGTGQVHHVLVHSAYCAVKAETRDGSGGGG
jgi:hypothetical protein